MSGTQHVKLGRNLHGYAGETLDISSVLAECSAAARVGGWIVERIPAMPKTDLLALNRPCCAAPKSDAPSGRACRSVYISAEIHGDEPAGPLAVLRLLQENSLPAWLNLWVCPCLNPTGFALNRRENGDGLDLNRQYLDPGAEEVIAHVRWLHSVPDFDLCLCLHEDWESHGFYIYELNPDGRPSVADHVVDRVSRVCPIDRSERIEGRPAYGGVIRPDTEVLSRPQWPEAFYLLSHKTRLSYTLEAPSDFPLSTRVAALVEAVKAAVEAESS